MLWRKLTSYFLCFVYISLVLITKYETQPSANIIKTACVWSSLHTPIGGLLFSDAEHLHLLLMIHYHKVGFLFRHVNINLAGSFLKSLAVDPIFNMRN